MPLGCWRDDLFKPGNERWKIIHDGVPDAIKIDIEVGVDQPVAHRDDLRPRDGRMRLLKLLAHLGRRLTNHFDQAHEGEDQHAIAV